MKDNVTIVTAFVDIGRGHWEGVKNNRAIPPYIKRDTETYFNRFERLTKLKNPIVCFTESKFFDRIKAMREDIELIAIDTVFEDHKHLINAIDTIQQDPVFIQFVNNPSSPEYWSPQYVAINFMKSHFVDYAVSQGWCKTGTAAWIDFGYVRDEVYCPEGKTWQFDTEGKINLFCMNQYTHTKPIFDIVRTGEVYMQGCHIVAPNTEWKVLKQLVNDSLSNLFNIGLVDDDQTLLLMAYRSAPEMFKLIPSDSNIWFTAFEGRCE
jgi:protein YibB